VYFDFSEGLDFYRLGRAELVFALPHVGGPTSQRKPVEEQRGVANDVLLWFATVGHQKERLVLGGAVEDETQKAARRERWRPRQVHHDRAAIVRHL